MPRTMLSAAAPWPRRRHALDVLERLIGEAKEETRRRAQAVEFLIVAGGDAAVARQRLGAARQRLGVARDRLVLLCRSRRCLLTGQPPEEPDRPGLRH